MISGDFNSMPVGMPVEDFSYIVDGALYSALEPKSEAIIPAQKVLIESMAKAAMPLVTAGAPSPLTARSLSISFPADSCSPGDRYQGDIPATAALAGELRPNGGVTKFIWQIACTHARIRYFVKFPSGFDWRLGGKLPGLSSADVSASGGNHATSGVTSFTARLMWQSGGRITPYLYMADNVSRFGTIYGVGLGSSVDVLSGSWVEIVEEVRLNDVGVSNGTCRISVNGVELCNRTDLIWRTNQSLKIDGVYFCLFFGGHTYGYSDNTYETNVNTSLEISDIEYTAISSTY